MNTKQLKKANELVEEIAAMKEQLKSLAWIANDLDSKNPNSKIGGLEVKRSPCVIKVYGDIATATVALITEKLQEQLAAKEKEFADL